MMLHRSLPYAVFALFAIWAAPAQAELPEGVRAMIDAARATGDAAKVTTALELARSAYPDEAEGIAAIEAEWAAAKAERDALAAAQHEETIRTAGLFDLWSGEGELGGFQSSGNSDTAGLTASLSLIRQGVDWTHRVRARADYQSQNGVTSRENLLFAYEPRWQFGEDVFAYGLAQFERDRVQGYTGRYAISGGLGYNIADNEDLSLSIKAGPAFRITQSTDGSRESRIAGLVGVDFDWRILERLALTQDVNALAEAGGQGVVVFDAAGTTLNLITGLDFRVTDSLRTRLSYQVDYDSSPPVGNVTTDTLTRATIIYGF
jgi:putative salt-induced outer membrane protein